MHAYELTESGVEPRHFVSMASRPDELRPTRITDLRKWWREGRIVRPSVTTIGDVLAKHALVNWKIDQHLIQSYRLFGDLEAEQQITDEAEYIAEIKRRTELEMDKAPKAGTDIHKSLEAYSNGELPKDSPDYQLCADALNVIHEKTEYIGWITEHNFISDLGYGGQVDLHNEDWVIDFKSKQTADKFKPGKMVWPDHSMQLAAYREGLGIPKARAANCFVCLEDGQVDFSEHTEKQLEKGWQVFYHALRIWQIQNNAPA